MTRLWHSWTLTAFLFFIANCQLSHSSILFDRYEQAIKIWQAFEHLEILPPDPGFQMLRKKSADPQVPLRHLCPMWSDGRPIILSFQVGKMSNRSICLQRWKWDSQNWQWYLFKLSVTGLDRCLCLQPGKGWNGDLPSWQWQPFFYRW